MAEKFPLMRDIKKAKDVDPEAYVRVISAEDLVKLKERAGMMLAQKQAEKATATADVEELMTIKTDIDALS